MEEIDVNVVDDNDISYGKIKGNGLQLYYNEEESSLKV